MDEALTPMLRYIWAVPNTLVGVLFLPAALLRGGHLQVVDGVLEAWGPLLSALLQRLPIAGGAAAITFGHIVLARDLASLDWTRAHERVHVRQCEIWGPLFIPAYLIAGLWAFVSGRDAYIDNYFERQALRRDGSWVHCLR